MAYLIGGLALFTECFSYSLHDGRRFRLWSGGSSVLWAAMYMELDAMTAAVTMGSTALRTVWSGFAGNGLSKHWVLVLFLGLFTFLTISSWQGAISLLPAFAVINTTLALFYLGNVAMRWALLMSSAAWIWNDLLWEAWPALFAESLAVLISLRTLLHLHRSMSDPARAS